jgi:hypothetical protein
MAQIRQIIDFSLNFTRFKLRNVERLHTDVQSIILTPIETARFADHRPFFKSAQIQRQQCPIASAAATDHNRSINLRRKARVAMDPDLRLGRQTKQRKGL